MSIYINGIGNISAQNTFGARQFTGPVNPSLPEGFLVLAPDYKAYVDPKLLRRMAKIIKMGVTAASEALRDAGIEMPDAITTATALGCTQDTDRFLSAMIELEEQTLSPTSFIQSTHNTIGGQIALQLGLHNYNMCYTQRGASFESALLDALLLLVNKEAQSVLVGGFDELIPRVKTLQERMGKYRHIQGGEGAAFFVLSEKDANAYAKLIDVQTLYKPEDNEALEQCLTDFLERNELKRKDINLVISGELDEVPIMPFAGMEDAMLAVFKPFCGEYQTAMGFAVWLAAVSLHNAEVPKPFMVGNPKGGSPKTVLVYNNYQDRNHSFILLSKC